jgi:flagellar hook-associated protein 3 FlgL
MLPPLSGNNQSYVDELSRMQSEMQTLQSQVTSGYRVQTPSDDPAAIGPILAAQTRIAQLQQSQTNLGQLQTELQTGDGALQQAIQLVESASSLASQASTNMNSNSASQAALLQQAQGILQTLVNISATTADGRYIFSGDLDQQALYALDTTQPNGVQQLATATSTRTVTDADGAPLWTAPTATQIFDPSNPDGSPATGNVFAAVNSLITALQNNDSAAATASVSSLQAADDYLNQQLGYYGIGETRVTDAVNAQSTSLVNEQQQLSGLQDTNVANAAVSLNQLNVEQQAALTSRAQFNQQQNLFNYLA